MADKRVAQLLWALILVGSGVLLLLFNFSLLRQFEPTAQYIACSGLVLVGGGFIAAYLSQRAHWWRLIPGWTLLALAAMVWLSVQPGFNRSVTAGVLFVGLALAFAHIYLVRPSEHWWAIIPGGFMLVLGIVISLSSSIERLETLATLLFVGMGTVFYLLYLLAGRRRHWWALIPGTVLVLFGVYVLVLERQDENEFLRWWPAILIVVGLFIGWQAWQTKAPAEKLSVNVAPGTRIPARDRAISSRAAQGNLGTYDEPAPGASVEILPDPENSEQEQ